MHSMKIPSAFYMYEHAIMKLTTKEKIGDSFFSSSLNKLLRVFQKFSKGQTTAKLTRYSWHFYLALGSLLCSLVYQIVYCSGYLSGV